MKAQRVFRLALTELDKEEYERAAQLFQRALESWPPDADKIVRFGPFVSYYYLPLFYIGRCYAGLEDCYSALRFFGLSRCEAEVLRTSDFGTLEAQMQECAEKTRSTKRPDRHKEYQEARSAYERNNWKEAALRMWEALQVWDESDPPGQTRLYGRYPEPYIPRFYLGHSLFELECYREALSQFEQTVVGGASEGGLEREARELARWTTEAKKRVDEEKETEICWQWACWLKSGEE